MLRYRRHLDQVRHQRNSVGDTGTNFPMNGWSNLTPLTLNCGSNLLTDQLIGIPTNVRSDQFSPSASTSGLRSSSEILAAIESSAAGRPPSRSLSERYPEQFYEPPPPYHLTAEENDQCAFAVPLVFASLRNYPRMFSKE